MRMTAQRAVLWARCQRCSCEGARDGGASAVPENAPSWQNTLQNERVQRSRAGTLSIPQTLARCVGTKSSRSVAGLQSSHEHHGRMARRDGVAFAALPLELLTLLMRSLCARDIARLARAVPAFSRPGSYFDEAVAALLAELHSVGCGERFVLPAETALHRLARLTGRRLHPRTVRFG